MLGIPHDIIDAVYPVAFLALVIEARNSADVNHFAVNDDVFLLADDDMPGILKAHFFAVYEETFRLAAVELIIRHTRELVLIGVVIDIVVDADGFAEPYVVIPLRIGIRKDIVCRGDSQKTLLCLRMRRRIGMESLGKTAVSLLYVLVRCVPLQPQNLIIIDNAP